ncbi:FAD-binding oxidoreductase [Cellulomonas massiliensis]|uniref:FAD-binding oxidoreductase n=1 Tax=Cellulomonas massiliensis TaxID=1465811 RepID=UPI000309D9AC|nr:FAD-binding protein [Cellulomonas massiliensis]
MTVLTPDTDRRPRTADTLVRALEEVAPLVHRPGSDRYAALTRTLNLAVAVRPLAVVEAAGPADVSATVRLAAAFGVPVGVQSTGHGATEEMAGAVLVHTGSLDEVTVHADERWARVGAGVRWQTVLDAAAPHGLGAICGSSPDVGVVGLLTGGGVGPLVRSHGLSADYVRAFEVVTGDGVARRVTATDEPDLFWGLRGGKGTLGIVTAVELDLVELPTFYGGTVIYDGDDAAAVVRTWSAWSTLLPQEGTTSVAVMRLPDLEIVPPPLRGRTAVALRFAWVGDPVVGEELLRAMRAVATPILDDVAVLPYAAVGAVHKDAVEPMPLHEASMLLEDFDLDVADRFLELVGPQAPCPLALVEVRQLGGRLRTGDDCAFAHRDAPFQVFAAGIAIPEIAQAVIGATATLQQGLAPWARDGGMPNFTVSAGRAWAERVFTPAVVDRLAALSRAHDPAGVLLAARGVRA